MPQAQKKLSRAKVRELWSEHNRTLDDIARENNTTRQTLRRLALAEGLPGRREAAHKLQSKAPADKFIELWNAGLSTQVIADYFGLGWASYVSRRARRLGLPRRPIGKQPAYKSVQEYEQAKLSIAMARLARETTECFALAEMTDGRTKQWK